MVRERVAIALFVLAALVVAAAVLLGIGRLSPAVLLGLAAIQIVGIAAALAWTPPVPKPEPAPTPVGQREFMVMRGGPAIESEG